IGACEYIQKLWRKKQSYMTNFLLCICSWCHQNKAFHHGALKHVVANSGIYSKPVCCHFKMVTFARSLHCVAGECVACRREPWAPFGWLETTFYKFLAGSPDWTPSIKLECSTQVSRGSPRGMQEFRVIQKLVSAGRKSRGLHFRKYHNENPVYRSSA
uniref:Large ribosomal subunit protein eL15 n=1 Tax=Anas platyrhynchos platyrhynchos TaxID=8840 RepID=A0A493TF46_ANAPP